MTWPEMTSSLKSPDWHEEILKDREQALSSGKVKVSDWEGAKERVRSECDHNKGKMTSSFMTYMANIEDRQLP
jgi:hypothetical protein